MFAFKEKESLNLHGLLRGCRISLVMNMKFTVNGPIRWCKQCKTNCFLEFCPPTPHKHRFLTVLGDQALKARAQEGGREGCISWLVVWDHFLEQLVTVNGTRVVTGSRGTKDAPLPVLPVGVWRDIDLVWPLCFEQHRNAPTMSTRGEEDTKPALSHRLLQTVLGSRMVVKSLSSSYVLNIWRWLCCRYQ